MMCFARANAHRCSHLRDVNLIHEVGRNLPGPRSHNDSLAIRYEPSETDRSRKRQQTSSPMRACLIARRRFGAVPGR